MEEVFHVSPGLSEFYKKAQNRFLAVAGWEFYHVVDSKLGTQLPISLMSLYPKIIDTRKELKAGEATVKDLGEADSL